MCSLHYMFQDISSGVNIGEYNILEEFNPDNLVLVLLAIAFSAALSLAQFIFNPVLILSSAREILLFELFRLFRIDKATKFVAMLLIKGITTFE